MNPVFKWLFKVSGIFLIIFLIVGGQASVRAKGSLVDYLHTLAPSGSHAITAPSASVTLVTFVDYQCEACAYTHKIIKELTRRYPGQLNLVFRHYPQPEHVNALKAAVAVEGAAAQGKFEQMHDKLLENQSEWVNLADPIGTFERYGKLFGPLPDPFAQPAFDQYEQVVKKDEADAKKLNVKGVPTTFVNGRDVGYITDVEVISKEIEKDLLEGFFKFYDWNTGKQQDAAPGSSNFEVIVTSDKVDVISKLPITVKYESGGKTQEQTIANDAKKSCRGADACSIPGPTDLAGDPKNWRITAYDPSGQEIAIYNGGVGSADSLWHWSLVEKQWQGQGPKNPVFAWLTRLWNWLRKR